MTHQLTVTVLIGLAVSLGFMSTDIYLPSMPAMVEHFGVSQNLVQMTIPPHFIGSAIAGLIGGSLSDRLGRKKILLAGLAILIMASFFGALAFNISVLMMCRLLQGVGVGMIIVAGITAVHELYLAHESGKALSGLGMSSAIAPATAPILGGYIQVALGWRANFLFVAIVGIILFCALAFTHKETKTPQNNVPLSLKKSFCTYLEMIKSRTYLRYALITPGLYAGEICFLTVLPIHFISILHVPTEIFGYYIAASVGCYFVASLLTPRLTKAIGADRTIKIALALAMVGALLQIVVSFVFPGSPVLITLLLCLNEIADAIAFGPSVNRLLEHFPKTKGAATALRNSLISVAAACGGFAGGVFDDTTTLPMGIFMLIIPLLIFDVAFGLPSQKNRRKILTN